jgi:hypothetical protein
MYPNNMPRGTPKTHFSEVANQAVRLPGFHDYIVYVCLNGPPDVIPENVLHTSLVCSTRISETERHCHVAIHPERRDERSRELVGLLHFYLVVPGIGVKEA